MGFLYDSSIYPVHHDRYGVPDAPREPFLARCTGAEILEIPPATLQLGGVNVPVGGGGYFRLLPYFLMKRALLLSRRKPGCGVTMLYFHPWEFDPDQRRLPLTRLNRFRTYVGIRRTGNRLCHLMSGLSFTRAVDLAQELSKRIENFPGSNFRREAGPRRCESTDFENANRAHHDGSSPFPFAVASRGKSCSPLSHAALMRRGQACAPRRLECPCDPCRFLPDIAVSFV